MRSTKPSAITKTSTKAIPVMKHAPYAHLERRLNLLDAIELLLPNRSMRMQADSPPTKCPLPSHPSWLPKASFRVSTDYKNNRHTWCCSADGCWQGSSNRTLDFLRAYLGLSLDQAHLLWRKLAGTKPERRPELLSKELGPIWSPTTEVLR